MCVSFAVSADNGRKKAAASERIGDGGLSQQKNCEKVCLPLPYAGMTRIRFVGLA